MARKSKMKLRINMDSTIVRSVIDLAGAWQAHLDPCEASDEDMRIPGRYESVVRLPGALSSQGFGEEIHADTQWTGDIFDQSWYSQPAYAPYRADGAVKVPFWLQPDRRYIGPAWYRKVVSIPGEFVGKRLVLFLERPHWETRLWFDDRYVGSNDSLSVPHEYDLGTVETAGEHRIDLRVDNRMLVNVGPNSHSMADHTQGNWNGIIGDIRLVARSQVWIDGIDLFPSPRRLSALVRVSVGNALGIPVRGRIRLSAEGRSVSPPRESVAMEIAPGNSSWSFEYRFAEGTELWDEFSPALQRLSAGLSVETSEGFSLCDIESATLGLREVATDNTQITINGRSIFLRGTLECCVFPLTGYPPTDSGSWRELIGRVKAHGLNHIRFHSWCPPEAAFSAADELGVFVQVECSTWANQGASVGEDGRFDEWLFRESERIVARYGNHPSFIMMAYGNEPAGRTEDFLGLWVSYWRGRDDRRIYTTAAGWPAIPENDYHVIPRPRIQAWGEGLNSRINARAPETRTDYREVVQTHRKPVVSHEIGQWCAFPDFEEIKKYTGPLKAKNFEIFRDFLANNHMGDQAHDFLIASGKLQVACYKEEIESALRTPGFAGFQLLGLTDFPGQGTALVGVLDAFWDSKAYARPEEFREFCAPTVPLARMDKRYWRLSESFLADLEVAHFGMAPIGKAELAWEFLAADGTRVTGDRFTGLNIPTGRLSSVGGIDQPLVSFAPGERYELVVSLTGGDGPAEVRVKNRWDIWVFEDELDTTCPTDIHACAELDHEALAVLDRGGSVFLSLPPDKVQSDVALGFSSVFWNTAWTNGQAPHSLGILCDPGHPAFAHFPTRSYSDWLWWELVHGAAAMVLDRMPVELRPIIQPIDTWYRSHRLGLLFEARVGAGRLLVGSMDLSSDLSRRLVARQLRYSLLRYMESEAFRPAVELDAVFVIDLLKRDNG
jgi:hypothetical protein